MKNLKKLLALVLVAVMVLSFGAVGASAAFTDTASSDFQEAIDVLSGIGVINGTTPTTYNPTGNLDRASAAKILAYMLLGPTNAALISSAASQTFSDVPTTHWASGYIDYCASQGLIAGTGDGTFNPNGALTTLAFTKMLLVALGYNADIEGYVGSNWAINIASDALTAGISDTRIPLSATAVCTREQAAQLAFKALTAKTVYYDGGSTITVGDTTITTGATLKFTAGNANAADNYDNNVDTYMQFCEKYFPLLKFTASTSDGFGRPAHMWKNNAQVIGLYKDTPVKVYTASMAFTPNVIATDLAGYTLPDDTAAPNTVYRSIDNVTQVTYTGAANLLVDNGVATAATTVSPNNQTTAAALAALTGNGKVVEFYADRSNHITKIVAITYTLGVISDIVSFADRTTYTITSAGGTPVTGNDYVSPTVIDTIYGQTGLAKGDTVTFVTTAGGSTYLYPTTKVTGIATSASTLGTVTVSGTTYTVGSKVQTDRVAATFVSASSFTVKSTPADYFIDQYGYVVKTTATAASTNYALITDAYGTLTPGLDGSTPSAQVRVVKTDGTVAVYTLKLIRDYTAAPAVVYKISGLNTTIYDSSDSTRDEAAEVEAAIDAALEKKVFGYTLADTTISLESLTMASGAMATAGGVYYDPSVDNFGYGVTSTSTNSEGETVLVNAGTVYVVYNSTLKMATVYTGNYGLPNVAAAAAGALDGCAVVMTNNAAGGAVGTAKYVFYSTPTGFGSAVAPTYVYINSGVYSTSLDAGNNTIYTYSGYLADGTTVELKSTVAGGQLTDSGVYTFNTDNTVTNLNLQATITNTLDADHDAGIIYDATLSVTGTLVAVSDTSAPDRYYSITENTKIVYVNPALATVHNNGGYIILEKVAGAYTTNIATIYITVD